MFNLLNSKGQMEEFRIVLTSLLRFPTTLSLSLLYCICCQGLSRSGSPGARAGESLINAVLALCGLHATKHTLNHCGLLRWKPHCKYKASHEDNKSKERERNLVLGDVLRMWETH